MRELVGNILGFLVFGFLGLIITVWLVTDTREVDGWLLRTRVELLGSL